MVDTFRKSQSLYCKHCAIISLVNSGVGKNCKKPKKLVIEPLCSFNKLMGTCINTIGWNTTNQ